MTNEFSRGVAACRWASLLAATALLPLVACSPQEMLVRRVADSLAAGADAEEEDLLLARDSAPAHLKASESLLRQVPDHLKLAETVSAGFTQYAYAFVAFEAEKLETRDARAAQRLQQRAARLYRRAHRHAMTALLAHRPGLTQSLQSPQAVGSRAASGAADALPGEAVGTAYWAAASWGAWIAMSKNDPDVVADFPRAHALARLAFERSPDHAEGALAALMGTFEVARPGGSLAEAETHFARAEAAGGGRNAGVYVAMAESLALPAGDRRRFEQLLRRALASAAGRSDLASQVMGERAAWLLATIDDRF
ncbi:MAG: hypothetical protein JNN03_22980 [Rubrivivax sp.]|nr:hypothetical protein [Rubrivivax sp.]